MSDITALIDESTSHVIVDKNGVLIQVSEAFCAAFGWKAEDLVGTPVTSIIPPNLHDSHHMGFSRFATTGLPQILDTPLDLEVVKGDGSVATGEHYIIFGELDGVPVFAARIIER